MSWTIGAREPAVDSSPRPTDESGAINVDMRRLRRSLRQTLGQPAVVHPPIRAQSRPRVDGRRVARVESFEDLEPELHAVLYNNANRDVDRVFAGIEHTLGTKRETVSRVALESCAR